MYPNMNMCQIEDGIIYQVDSYNKVPIGYTNDAYNDLAETTQQYYDKLVELGAIVPPKTQEEINKELQAELLKSQEMNARMMTMMSELEQKYSVSKEVRPAPKRKTPISEPKEV